MTLRFNDMEELVMECLFYNQDKFLNSHLSFLIFAYLVY